LLSLDVVTSRLEVIFFFSGDVVTTVIIYYNKMIFSPFAHIYALL